MLQDLIPRTRLWGADLLLNMVESLISAWPKWSGGNDLYQLGTSSQKGKSVGLALQYFTTWSIGSDWLVQVMCWYYCTYLQRHDLSMCVTRRIQMCGMTHSYVWHDSFMCDMTYLYLWHDVLICVTWFIHTRDMIHSNVWHDTFICVTWLIHMYNTPDSHVWHDPFTCVTWRHHAYEGKSRISTSHSETKMPINSMTEKMSHT